MAPTAQFAEEFIGWPASKQAKYFNALPDRSRMDLVAALITAHDAFMIANVEIRFFPDGSFAYDRISDEGYASLKDEPEGKNKMFVGRWSYSDGKISLQDDPGLDIFSDNYIWVGAKAEKITENKVAFSMKIEGDDDWEEGLSFGEKSDSPSILSYIQMKSGRTQ